MAASDVVITGIGIVSSLGEGVDLHWATLSDPDFSPRVDSERFAPYPIHPLIAVDWSQQIPGRSDQRQMDGWQKTGVYAAGLALEDAGIKGNDALCSTMDMIVAAGGGERDDAVDRAILSEAPTAGDTGVLLNKRLKTELRPTLFLAQLSNLLAGNISIVHKVTGSSQSFMGEEAAGISALQTAVARITSGQATHMLIGGAFNCEHPEFLLLYEIGGRLLRGDWKSVWDRKQSEGGGVVLGSAGCFLVLESAAHAAARGAKAYARLSRVEAGSARRNDDYRSQLRLMADRTGGSGAVVISGASGAHRATSDERAAFDGTPLRGIANAFGHLKEAQFPTAVAVAAMAVSRRQAPTAFAPDAEAEVPAPVTAALATTVGYHRSEGIALLEAVRGDVLERHP